MCAKAAARRQVVFGRNGRILRRERERERGGIRWGNETTLRCHISSLSSISLQWFLPVFSVVDLPRSKAFMVG